MSKQTNPEYLPALRFRWLTPFYDWISATTIRERRFKQALIKQAHLEPGQQVLDLGSGTGTLAIWIKQHQPLAEVTGVDCDTDILAIAAKKAKQANVSVQFDRALSYGLPYPDEYFDRVVSTLFFHHLSWEEKERTALELFRILKPAAQLHIADFGRAASPLMRTLFLMVQLFDGFKCTRDNVAGNLPALFEQAGFVDVREMKSLNTIFGTIAIYSAVKPGER